MLGSKTWLALALLTAPWLNAQAQPAQPMAEVAGQVISEDDLLSAIGPQLADLRNQEFELKMKTLTSLIQQKLVAAEAKKRDMTMDELWDQVVEQKVEAVTPAEVEAFYLAQQDRIKKPLAEVRAQLEQNLLQAKKQRLQQAFIDQLRKQSAVKIFLDRPRFDISADVSRLRGNPKAPVTIVEFGDFQCPYCRAVQSTLDQLMKKYEGRIQLSFRDLPLRQIHPRAEQAAEAARCAGDQGKFWEYHDLLYAEQSKLGASDLKDQALAAGADADRFEECLESGKFRPQIEQDLQTAIRAGVNATPTFFINGMWFSGAQPLSAFEDLIDTELERLGPESKQ